MITSRESGPEGTVHSSAILRAVMEWAAQQMPKDARRNSARGARISRRCRNNAGQRHQNAAWARTTYHSNFGPALPSARNRAALPRPCSRYQACHRYRANATNGSREQHAGREILGQQEETVAFHVIGFHRRGAPGGVRIVMFYHGIRNVEAFPPGPSGAQAQIGIFAIKKEAGVEAARLFQHAATVKGRRSTRKKRLFEDREILRGRPWPRCLLLPSRAISMPAESRRSSPKKRTCEAHMPTSGRRSMASSRAASQFGLGTASSLSVAR